MARNLELIFDFVSHLSAPVRELAFNLFFTLCFIRPTGRVGRRLDSVGLESET